MQAQACRGSTKKAGRARPPQAALGSASVEEGLRATSGPPASRRPRTPPVSGGRTRCPLSRPLAEEAPRPLSEIA